MGNYRNKGGTNPDFNAFCYCIIMIVVPILAVIFLISYLFNDSKNQYDKGDDNQKKD